MSMVTTLLTICLFRVVCILLVLPSFETMECIVWIYIGSWIVSGVTFTVLYLAKVRNSTIRKVNKKIVIILQMIDETEDTAGRRSDGILCFYIIGNDSVMFL